MGSDSLGQLNLLTAENTVRAAKEIKTGVRISLNLALDEPVVPFTSGRILFERRELALEENKVYDDEIHLNTQSSSQWDGFKHFAAKDGSFYGGMQRSDPSFSETLGIHNWCRKGIVGRGVLVDVRRLRPNLYNPLQGEAVTLEVLKECIREQGISLLPADILLIRFGFVSSMRALTREETVAYAGRKEEAWAGLEQSTEALQWFKDHAISAVVADNPSVEVFPSRKDFLLHEHFLPLMGLPIGELFDLEELSQELHRQNRSTFFFVSEPLHIPGGVASPPQALGIL